MSEPNMEEMELDEVQTGDEVQTDDELYSDLVYYIQLPNDEKPKTINHLTLWAVAQQLNQRLGTEEHIDFVSKMARIDQLASGIEEEHRAKRLPEDAKSFMQVRGLTHFAAAQNLEESGLAFIHVFKECKERGLRISDLFVISNPPSEFETIRKSFLDLNPTEDQRKEFEIMLDKSQKLNLSRRSDKIPEEQEAMRTFQDAIANAKERSAQTNTHDRTQPAEPDLAQS